MTMSLPNQVIDQIQEWRHRTGGSLRDLALLDYAILLDEKSDGSHQVQFVKCRDRNLVTTWCHQSWGAPDDVRWHLIETNEYNPCVWIQDSSDVAQLIMTWSGN
jgi:hypothetical protein